MNVLFMSLGVFNDLSEGSVHIDLVKEFAKEHEVWLACKHEGQETTLTEEYGIHVLRIHTGTLKKAGLVKKGINTILVEPQFKNAIKKHLSDVRFDLVLYTTPPITFASAVRYIKERDGATTYLLLKDIFPQNAVDLGMMSKSGPKGLIYKYFRNKEKELYALSDYIGCMSPANERYIIDHNPEIDPQKVEECPNATVIEDKSVSAEERETIRKKYGIPLDKKVFVYGGNLGKPQGIPFVVDCLRACKEIKEAFFLIIGQGTEYKLLESYEKEERPENFKLMKQLPKSEFETLVAACDIGMIFLDHRFTIPNFPSRLLSYMKAKVPVLAATDPNTDVGTIIEEGGFGWWCESSDVHVFKGMTEKALASDVKEMGEMGNKYMEKNYDVDCSSKSIMKHFIAK